MLHELVEHFQLKHRNLLRTLGIFLENNTIPLVVSVYMSYGSVIPWLKDHGTPETTTNIVSHMSVPILSELMVDSSFKVLPTVLYIFIRKIPQ